jgi:type I restriction enzyme M protein
MGEIRENDYNLNIPRYVDSSDDAESWDLYASMFGGIPKREIDALSAYWEAFPALRSALFSKSSSAYSGLKPKDVKRAIREHADVVNFTEAFTAAFKDLGRLLRKELLTNRQTVDISNEEEVLSQAIFKRLAGIPLIDKYEAYQILDDEWNKVSVDLEIIQTEGFEATKKVDPHMVIKKKEGKEQEVQEGWEGHVLPFKLVQETLLSDEYKKLSEGENRLSELAAECQELLESFNDDEKDSDSFNDDKDAFAAAGVAREARQIRADLKKGEEPEADSYEARILKADLLLTEEKKLNTDLKAAKAAFHLKTKAIIEKLPDKEVMDLLERKWITPMLHSLHTLPDEVVATLSAAVNALSQKYETTYKEVVEQIHETEASLSTLIDDLIGNDYDLKGLAEFQQLLKGE